MKIFREAFEVASDEKGVKFHEVTRQVRDILKRSQIKNGLCVVYSHHTTCSVMTQECSFDVAYTGLEYLQQDLCDVFENIIPTCRKEGQYMHPGPKLTEFAAEHGESKPETLTPSMCTFVPKEKFLLNSSNAAFAISPQSAVGGIFF